MTAKRAIFLLLLWPLWMACGTPTLGPALPPAKLTKSAEALAACRDINLVGAASLQAAYLIPLSRCLSDLKTGPQGQTESLAPVLEVFDQLQPDGLDALIGLGLVSQDDRYPNTELMSRFLTRGIATEDSVPPWALSQRFERSERLLQGLGVGPIWSQLLQWSQTDKLEHLMIQAGLLLPKLPEGALAGPLEIFLSTPDLRHAANDVLIPLLEDEKRFALLLQAATVQSSLPLPSEVQADCRQNLEDPQPSGAPSPSCQILKGGHTERQQAPLAEFWQELTGHQRAQLSRLLQELWQSVFSWPEERVSRLLAGLRGFVSQASQSQRDWLPYALHVLYKLQTLKAADFAPLAEALTQVSSQESLFGSLKEKMGTALLRDRLEGLIREGGLVPGCGSLLLEPVDGDNRSLQPYLQTHPDCQNWPPLVRLIKAEVETWCQKNDCSLYDRNLEPRWSRDEPYAVDQVGSAAGLAPLWQEVSEAIQTELTQTPLALSHRNLAYDAIEPELWAEAFPPHLQPKDLAELKASLAAHSILAAKLPAESLATLIGLHLQKAAAYAYERSHFFAAEDPYASGRLLRAARGLYADGPLFRTLSQKLLSPEMDDLLAAADLNPHPLLTNEWQRKRFQLQRMEAVFKNPHLSKRQDQQWLQTMPGASELHSFTFDPDGTLNKPKLDSLNLAELFKNGQAQQGDPKEHAALWSQWLAPGPVASLNAPKALEIGFQTFLEQMALPLMEQPPSYDEQARPGVLYSASLEQRPYRLEEKRALAFFLVRSLIGLPLPSLQQDWLKLASSAERSKSQLTPAFMGLHFFATPDASWQAFQQILPTEVFRGPARQLGSSLLPLDLASYNRDWANSVVLERQNTNPHDLIELPASLGHLLALNLIATRPIRGQLRKPQRTLHPLIGIDAFDCPLEDADSSSCPATIVSSAAPDAPPIQAYDKLRELTEKLFQASLCSPIMDGHFSNAFQEMWSHELELDELCQTSWQKWGIQLYRHENNYPTAILEQILKDLITAGTMRLKPGLAALTLNSKASAKELLEQGIIISNRQAALQAKRFADAQDFHQAGLPLVNAYLNYAADLFGPDLYRSVYRQMGDQVLGETGLSDLFNLISTSQKQHEKAGSTALTWLLDLLQQLVAEPAYPKAMGLLLAYGHDAELLDLFGMELGLGLRDLYYKDGVYTFSWQNRGHNLLKQLLRRETLLPGLRLLSHLRPQDLESLVTLLAEKLQILGQPAEQAGIMEQSFTAFQDYGFSSVGSEGAGSARLMASEWDFLLKQISVMDLPSNYWQQFQLLCASSLATGRNLANEPAPALASLIPELLDFAFRHGHRSLEILQQSEPAMANHRFSLRQMAEGILQPLAAERDTQALWSTMQDTLQPEGAQWLESMLQDRGHRSAITSGLRAMDLVAPGAWLDLLSWIQTLSPVTRERIIWAYEHIRWRPDHSPSYQLFYEHLVRLLSTDPERDLFHQQLGLVTAWIHRTQNIRRNNHATEHTSSEPFRLRPTGAVTSQPGVRGPQGLLE